MIFKIKGILNKGKYFLFFILLILSSCRSDPNSNYQEEAFNSTHQIEGNIEIPSNLSSYYADIDFTKTQRELKEQLSVLTISKHSNFLQYYERHDHLYDANKDSENSNNVILFYSGESRNNREHASGSNSYSKQTFNTEHVYPKYYLNSNAEADLHNLVTADIQINKKRSNYSFVDGKGTYKHVNYKNWYPGDEWIGDVARIIMYMHLRYNENFQDMGNLNLFLKWNVLDPVSDLEIQRNERIMEAQGNRNPFIDNPYFATLIWDSKAAENRWKSTNKQGEEVSTQKNHTVNSEIQIIFSEYVEGNMGNNKAIEIANLTDKPIALNGYSIKKQANGTGKWTDALNLDGTIPANDVYVIINKEATLAKLLEEADIEHTGSPLNFNGNDPIGLFKNNRLIDIIGNFNSPENFGKDLILRRKSSIKNPSSKYIRAEWDVVPHKDLNDIGSQN
ncbi:endonuclease [Gillisia sp. M10.2A]|uniref:Endonuclease n=1 Tax=Gillisia lutea TaxID=2909668 RepID=A0ABS9EIW5_9FLAO|nr:endonuclease [Gillisia lutea]MCF4101804.1 endonuclease [Gillisia lutea]